MFSVYYQYNMLKNLYILMAAAISLIAMPLIINFCKKKQLYDYQNARKIHTGNIPRLGGAGIFFAFIITAAVYLYFSHVETFRHIVPVLIAGSIIFVFALLDDIVNLPAILKLIVQLAATAVVVFNGFCFKQIFGWVLPLPLSYILSFGWVLGVINAYNLIDGLDGLCGSLSFLSITTLGIIFQLSGNQEYLLCYLLAAAIFGFLCFNWPPAKLFMGDAGSQFIGFMIATFPLFDSGNIFEHNKFLIMIVLTAFPVFDTIAAIWRRIRDKHPIMSADRAHLHHKLLNMGYSKNTTLYLLVFLQFLVCGSVVISFFLGEKRGMALLFETTVFVTLFFAFVHYTNRAINLKKQREETGNTEVEKTEAAPEEK